MPRNWDSANVCAEPKCFVSGDSESGTTVNPGTRVLFERVVPGVMKKVKAKLAARESASENEDDEHAKPEHKSHSRASHRGSHV